MIHSFWVPQLNGKTDLVPGQTNHLSFTADSAGTYRGQCAEFCGIQHAKMAFLVVVQEPADYARWLAANRATAAAAADRPTQRAGAAILASTSCAGCHNVRGTPADGDARSRPHPRRQPGDDRRRHAGERPRPRCRRWLADTQGVKPGALMPQIDLTDDQVAALVAYLESLK